MRNWQMEGMKLLQEVVGCHKGATDGEKPEAGANDTSGHHVVAASAWRSCSPCRLLLQQPPELVFRFLNEGSDEGELLSQRCLGGMGNQCVVTVPNSGLLPATNP